MSTLDDTEPQRDHPARSRQARVSNALNHLEEARGAACAKRYNALAVLISEAVLARDLPALLSAQRGLRRVLGLQLVSDSSDAERVQRGRVMSLLDVTSWCIDRVARDTIRA